MNGLAFPDMEHRCGVFADAGPEGERSAYFATRSDAVEFARALWKGLTAEERRATDIYAGEINLHRAYSGPLTGRLVWDTVAIFYDAKAEEVDA